MIKHSLYTFFIYFTLFSEVIAQNPAIFVHKNKGYDKNGKVVFTLSSDYERGSEPFEDDDFFHKLPTNPNAFVFRNKKDFSGIIVNNFGTKTADISKQHSFISSFQHDIAIAKKGNNKFIFINSKNQNLFGEREFSSARQFSNGLALCSIHKDYKRQYFYINEKGEEKINLDTIFSDYEIKKCSGFHNDFALISLESMNFKPSRTVLIDKEGEIIVDFNELSPFNEKKIRVYQAFRDDFSGDNVLLTTSGYQHCQKAMVINKNKQVITQLEANGGMKDEYDCNDYNVYLESGIVKIKYSTSDFSHTLFYDLKGNLIFHKENWEGFALNNQTLVLYKEDYKGLDTIQIYSIAEKKVVKNLLGSPSITKINENLIYFEKFKTDNKNFRYADNTNCFYANGKGEILFQTPKAERIIRDMEAEELRNNAILKSSDDAPPPPANNVLIREEDIPIVPIEPHQENNTTDGDSNVYTILENMAQFQGGKEALIQWSAKNLIYPDELKNEKIEGRVVVKMIIEKDGSISSPVLLKKLHPLLDQEVMRLVSVMPKLIPGSDQNGKKYRSYLTLPFDFPLRK